MATNLAEADRGASRGPAHAGGSWAYLRGMESWAGTMLELLAHAAEVADSPSPRGQLMGARDDAAALRDLLHTATRRHDPNPNASATIESICELWDVNQHRFEELAAEADPDYHALWLARSALTRLSKHGPPPADDDALPFSG
jgi:hypothetical protein